MAAASAAGEAERPIGSGTAMTKPYDATTWNLYEMNPAEWSAYLGHPVVDPGRVRRIDSNLSTITAEVDRVIRLEDPIPWLWHIEFQAGRDLGLAIRLHFYVTDETCPARAIIVDAPGWRSKDGRVGLGRWTRCPAPRVGAGRCGPAVS
jgi:hypothetical protein